MFLDIQMPGLSDFDLLAQVPQSSLPMIVFVTTFDHFALDAFEAHALDYLLKAVDDMRLARALERVRAQWQQRQAVTERAQLMALLAQVQGRGEIEQAGSEAAVGQGARRHASVLPIRAGRETLRLEVASIDWIDAAGDYMCLHAGGLTHALRATMNELEDLLDPQVFQRAPRAG